MHLEMLIKKQLRDVCQCRCMYLEFDDIYLYDPITEATSIAYNFRNKFSKVEVYVMHNPYRLKVHYTLCVLCIV